MLRSSRLLACLFPLWLDVAERPSLSLSDAIDVPTPARSTHAEWRYEFRRTKPYYMSLRWVLRCASSLCKLLFLPSLGNCGRAHCPPYFVASAVHYCDVVPPTCGLFINSGRLAGVCLYPPCSNNAVAAIGSSSR